MEYTQGENEDGNLESKSAKAIRLLREVSILLRETTDQPRKHVTTGQVGTTCAQYLLLTINPVCHCDHRYQPRIL